MITYGTKEEVDVIMSFAPIMIERFYILNGCSVTSIVDRTNNHQIMSFQTGNLKLDKVLASFIINDLNGNKEGCLDLLDGDSDG